MGKKLMAILALALCLLFAFAACDGGNNTALTEDGSAAAVSSNGGFLAETGDYVYFINGNELYTEDNTSGKVEKGALIRVKKSELYKGAKAEKEVVVSKLVSTGDYSAGVSIYGGRIYFATPSTEKDKTGNVQNADIKFCSAKLDGTDVKEFATAKGSAGNAAAYRFTEAGGKVYAYYLSTETEEENGTETTKNYINVVEDNGNTVAKEEYATYVFDKNASGKYVYFTKSVKNETLDITESFNEVYRLEIGKDKAEKILYGAGSNRNEQDGKEYTGKGVQGVTYTLVAAQNGYLYFSVVNIDTSVSTDTYYAFLGETLSADTEENLKNATVMTYGGSSSVFAATSIYESPNCIVYLDTTKGLCSYNYADDTDYDKYYGVTVEYYSSEILTATVSHVANGYLYYQISGVYGRLPYENGHIASGSEAQQLSPVTFSTSWYAPEVVKVGEKEYVLGTVSAEDYYDYVMAYEILDKDTLDKLALDEAFDVGAFLKETVTDEDDLADLKDDLKETKYGEFLTATSRESVLYNWGKSVSLLGEDAQKEIDEYIDRVYPDGNSSSSSSEEGCSSAMGASAVIGVAFVAAAGVFAGKKRK